MRSELVVISQQGFGVDCRVCSKLGYISKATTPDKVFQRLNNLKSTASDRFVIHISAFAQQEFFKLIQNLGTNIQPCFVGCKDCFKSHYADGIDGFQKALIKTTLNELSMLEPLPQNTIEYFYLNEDTNLENFAAATAPRIVPLKFFTKFKTKNSLKICRLVEKVCESFSQLKYELPFGHDQIDDRYPEHINWIFEPSTAMTDSTILNRAPLISIIIPFHNRSLLVKKVLTALFKQSLSAVDFEILLLDDGSHQAESSALVEFVSAHKGFQINYQYVPRKIALDNLFIGNRVGPIRNLGLRLARAEILLFLDADILLPSNYLQYVLAQHENFDVLLPKRVYLNKWASDKSDGSNTSFSAEDFLAVPWENYLNKIFDNGKWLNEPHPWKFFMTYALSVKKNILLRSGGFRTNYVSYGYEDLDLGYRTLQQTEKISALNCDVFHLYHFNSDAEYDLSSYKRYFQLAFSSRMFTLQNGPRGNHDLNRMHRLRTLGQMVLFYWYLVRWKMNLRMTIA